MTYCTGNESITYHAYAIGTRSHPRSPYCRPFVRESTRNAALWDWYCFFVRLNKLLINQSNRRWVQKLQHSRDVTVMSERDIGQLTLCSKIRNKRRGEISLISWNIRLFQHHYHLDNFRWNQSRKGVHFVEIPVSLIYNWHLRNVFNSQVKPWAYLYRHGWLMT